MIAVTVVVGLDVVAFAAMDFVEVVLVVAVVVVVAPFRGRTLDKMSTMATVCITC